MAHVQRLLSKLPADFVAYYARHARTVQPNAHYNLLNFSLWLQGEAECQAVAAQATNLQIGTPQVSRRDYSQRPKFPPSSATILYGTNSKAVQSILAHVKAKPKFKFPCSYCQSLDHPMTNCVRLKEPSTEKVTKWIKEQGRCWRCGRKHMAANCDLNATGSIWEYYMM